MGNPIVSARRIFHLFFINYPALTLGSDKKCAASAGPRRSEQQAEEGDDELVPAYTIPTIEDCRIRRFSKTEGQPISRTETNMSMAHKFTLVQEILFVAVIASGQLFTRESAPVLVSDFPARTATALTCLGGE